MEQRKGVTCCCRTDHGGYVLEGYATMKHKAHAVAGLGHRVWCPRCNGIFPIVESLPSRLGYAPATEGMRTACGARLISTWDDLWFYDSTTQADDQPSAPPGNGESQPASPPPAPSHGLSSTAFEAARTIDAEHVVLRIGVFHDGTGNNYTNSTKAQDQCAPLAVNPPLDRHADLLTAMMNSCLQSNGMNGPSYTGGETNVHRLHDLYKVTRSLSEAEVGSDGHRCVYRHAYIDGVATEADHDDSLLAGATGYGPTGVVTRAEDAILAVIAQIKEFYTQSPNIIIDAVVLDLFGFSRGATASRHFAYLVWHGGMDSRMARALRTAGLPLNPEWGMHKGDLKLGFVGLFDSVAALGIPGNDKDDPAHIYLPKDCADCIIHLVAGDECRYNFALNSVEPHVQIVLWGVHSDVGGGYAMRGWEHLILGRPETSEEPLGSNPLDSDAWDRAFRQQETYDWWDDTLLDPDDTHRTHGVSDNKLFIDTWTSYGEGHAANEVAKRRRQYVTAAVVLKRHVRGEYQLIPLRVMHALAQDKSVPFKRIPNEPQFALPGELASICEKQIAHALHHGSGKAKLTDDEKRLLRRRYLHQSANWNPVIWNPRPGKKEDAPAGPEITFAMRPTNNRKRNAFPQKDGH